MTFSNPDCGTIVFYTTTLQNIDPGLIGEIYLTRKFNCGSSSSVDLIDYKLQVVTSDADGTTFTITAPQYYSNDDSIKFCEGIYYFYLYVQYAIEGGTATWTDTYCAFIDCENIIKCQTNDYVLATKDVRPYYMLDALTYSMDCDTCDCSNMCSMYNDLLATINISTTNDTTSGCGCS